jgi:glycosyltransferase involved in cell wall biosynthesis
VSGPRVSVHVLSYNQKEFLREAIESALAQDYANLEIVVADDASSDGSQTMLQDYASEYPSRVIPVIGDRNLGLSGNGNRGLEACSGDYIAFMGGDDVLLPGKISAQVDWLSARSQRVLCAHQVEVFYEDQSKPPHPLSKRLTNGKGAREIIRHQPFGAVSVMVRADRIPAHGFRAELPMVSDNMMWIEVLREDGEFGCVPGTLARYRRHGASVSADPFRYLGEVEHQFDILEREFPEFREDVQYAKTRRLYYDVGVSLMKADRKKEARAKFVAALRREPKFGKAWIRVGQSLL